MAEDNSTVLLQMLVKSNESLNAKMENMSNFMVDKNSFEKFQTNLEKKLESVDAQSQETQNKINKINNDLNIQGSKLNANTNFISNISSGGKWFFRVVIVALIGVFTSVAPAFISNTFNKNNQSPTQLTAPYLLPSAAPNVSSKP